MNAKKKIAVAASEPTKSELEILQVIWAFGPSTARFVNDQLNKETRPVMYMSTLKLMQIMVDKQLLKKDERQRSHVYSAAVEESKTKKLLLDRVVDTLFNGSAGSLVQHLLGNRRISAEEIAELKKMIKDIDKKS